MKLADDRSKDIINMIETVAKKDPDKARRLARDLLVNVEMTVEDWLRIENRIFAKKVLKFIEVEEE